MILSSILVQKMYFLAKFLRLMIIFFVLKYFYAEISTFCDKYGHFSR